MLYQMVGIYPNYCSIIKASILQEGLIVVFFSKKDRSKDSFATIHVQGLPNVQCQRNCRLSFDGEHLVIEQLTGVIKTITENLFKIKADKIISLDIVEDRKSVV